MYTVGIPTTTCTGSTSSTSGTDLLLLVLQVLVPVSGTTSSIYCTSIVATVDSYCTSDLLVLYYSTSSTVVVYVRGHYGTLRTSTSSTAVP